jgi:septum site-determining protein MinD
MDMVKRGDMMSVDDVLDILAIDLLGVVPDDESIVVATNEGEPLVGDDSDAGKAYMNICKRLMGEDVPFMEFDAEGIFKKIIKLFKRGY